MTNFVVGQVYELRRPCWMRERTLLTFHGREPADSEGMLRSGTKIQIQKVVVERGPEVGTYTDVFAEVLTGEHKGKIVNVGVISKILKNGYAKRDPEMLEPVRDEIQ